MLTCRKRPTPGDGELPSNLFWCSMNKTPDSGHQHPQHGEASFGLNQEHLFQNYPVLHKLSFKPHEVYKDHRRGKECGKSRVRRERS